jgi:hypothetical protein
MTDVPWLGKIRRSQVITTYGIGSIVDLEPGSFVPLGLEEWEKQTRLARKSSFTIYEARLQAQLAVDEFRMAPILEEVQNQPNLVKSDYAIPVYRFPRWLECPKCHRLGTENKPFEAGADERQLRCTACNQKVNPVRFVQACARGHLSDFPWAWWAHKNRETGICENPVLYLRSHGKSAALADLYVQCMNPSCKATKSMGDAFKKSALAGLKCQGRRIWLLDKEACDRDVRTLQRGASNIHFPAVVSALSIPPVSEPVQQLIDEHWSVYQALPEASLEHVLAGSAEELGIPVQVLLSACRRRKALERGEDAEDGGADLRFLEYAALSGSTEEIPAIGGYVSQFQNVACDPPPAIQEWFDTIGAVSRLREVRAMVGFSRIEPQPVSIRSARQLLRDGTLAPLAKSNRKWLPAAEIRGEGIFLRFRNEKIESWLAGNPEILRRSAEIDRWSKRVAAERGYEPEYDITPRLLLVHAFAHIMIRRLSIECGYSSAALRERLYIKEEDDDGPAMHGVLIYTGTPDSEGSLGGLVRLADPARLGPLVVRALKEAQWCGSDPVCLETEPDVAGERISGAACHCCLLVPETACEKFNKELDRSMLVGHAERKWKGFFDGIGSNEDGANDG